MAKNNISSISNQSSCMCKKNNESNPCVCQKLRGAFSKSPAFHAIRRVSNSNQDKFPVSPIPNSQPSTHKVQTPPFPSNNLRGHAKTQAELGHGDRGGEPREDVNSRFSDYIKRAKIKIRTVSNIGRVQNKSTSNDHDTNYDKRNHSKDSFSNFIHRARMKIRTTTIAGRNDHKTVSSKRE